MIVRPVLCKPFVGRRAELAYLRERRLEAGASRGGLVFVAGDAGLGKTRLISEFCRSLAYSRWRITYGPCREFGGRPYGPILDALSSIDPSVQVAPADSKRQYFEAIVDRLAAFAARKALVVVLEDVHWADAATLDLLAYLGSRLHNMRVLVLASFRPDDLHAGHPAAAGIENVGRSARAGRIDLAPLAGLELRTFIDEALSGYALSDDTRRSIALTGEGNPFFTEELLKNAVQEVTERRGRASGSTRVPHGVRSTLLERLRPFDDQERRIVTQAAVIGRTFSLELLASVSDIDSEHLLPALRRARDFQLIEELEPSVFRFRHGLTREAICGDFLSAELRPLHRRIALSLEMAGERAVEALAYHWWAAGDDGRSAYYNVLAGDAARAVYAHEDAIAFYRRALEAKDLDALTRGSILEKIANVRLVLSMAEEGLATYRAAADAYQSAGASEREAVCRVRAAMTDYTMRLNDTSPPLERMLERLDASEFLARARLHLGIAWIASALRFPSRAKEHLAQVDARAGAGATDVAVRYHNVAACVATDLADVDGLRREHAAWLEAARVHGSGAIAGAYYNGAKFFASFALHDEALENIRRALQAAHEWKSVHAAECAHATAALCYMLSGDLQALRAEVDAVPTTTDNRVNLTFARAAATAAAAYSDDETLIETWFDGFDDPLDSVTEIECGYGFAELLVRRGRRADAQALLHRVLPDCELVRGQVMTLLSIARHGVAADRARAREYLVRAAAMGDSLERPALALFDATCCVVQQPERARTLALEAAEGFRHFRTPLLEADARELAGDIDGALALYRRCGASFHVRRLERLLDPAAAGAAKQAAATVSAGTVAPNVQIAGLSAREREIVTLAAGGHSNLEIARSLSISHKTVEKHLGAAFQKLGVSSRRALRDYVR